MKEHAPYHTLRCQFAERGTQSRVATCQCATTVTAVTNATLKHIKPFTAKISGIIQTILTTFSISTQPSSKILSLIHAVISNNQQSTTIQQAKSYQYLTFNHVPNTISSNYPYTISKQLLQLESNRDNKLLPLPLHALATVTPLVHEEYIVKISRFTSFTD